MNTHIGGTLTELLRAASEGDAQKVAAIADANPSLINERGVLDGHSGLRTALHFGVHHEPVVRALLERGADPNIRDEGDNAFPLHFAVERGDMAIIRLLVEHGAQMVAGDVDDHELDIIGWACAWQYVSSREELVQYLLEHGARHTMFSAVAMGATGAIRELAAQSPDAVNKPMDRTNHRRRPLHLAVIKKQRDALVTLLELGADVNATDAAGLAPLDQAALDSEPELVRILLDHGAAVGLPAAVSLGRTADIERLLRDDPDALKPGHRWGTLIVRAAGRARGPVVELLIRSGASPDAVDDMKTAIDQTSSYTALHEAAWEGNAEAVRVLLEHGANPRVRDGKYDGTPAGWANYNNKPGCRDLILASEGIDIFDAITLGRADLIPRILERDPGALNRPYGAYSERTSQAAHLSPLAWATFHDNPAAVRVLMSRGAELASGGVAARTPEERVAAFLRMACLDWAVGGPERQQHTAAAGRLLERHPEIARAHFLTAVVCGLFDEVQRTLAERPAAATEPGGPRGWPPILYLSSARLPDSAPSELRRGTPGTAWSDRSVDIARALLDAGADPNVYYEGGNADIHYTCITSLVGRGEEQATVHPRARELAALLLERGAEPYDMQFFYNAFAGHASQRFLRDDDFVWLLDLMYEHSLRRGRAADWQDPEWKMIGMGGYGDGALYLQRCAAQANQPQIAEWAVRHGGRDYRENFRLKPEATDLFVAAEHNHVETAQRLLDEGVSPNIRKPKGGDTPLHHAAYNNSLDVIRLLIERGADVDPVDGMHGTTPINWAFWGGSHEAVDALTPLTRDVWALTRAGKLDRLRAVIAAEPRLAKLRDDNDTILFYLPDDEEVAAQIVELLLANGADPTVKRKDGATAADVARSRGLDRAAEMLAR